jgi:3-deoxy-manno-octulosonate cytidylyltransferase (CMP-KDO synthetase)
LFIFMIFCGPALPDIVVIVPARAASTRFPGKSLALLRGATGISKPLVQRSWEAACRVGGVARVIVATDDSGIAAVVSGFGGEVMLTPNTCRNGTERCAAVMMQLPRAPGLVINLQGDAPLTQPAMVAALMAGTAPVRTPVIRASEPVRARLLADAAAGRVGGTTCVFDAKGRALYFSKRVLPWLAPGDSTTVHFHVGVYAYTPAALAAYAAAPPSVLEMAEGLEQLRFLDAGICVQAVLVEPPDADLWEVNNPQDIAPVEAMLARLGIA